MAISVTSLINSGDATDRTGPSNPYATGTIIAAGSSSDINVLAIIGIMGTSVTPPAPSTVTGGGVTWTKDTRVGGGTGVLGFKTTAANRFSVSLWYALGPTSSGGGSGISIDFGSNAMIGASWQLLRIQGGDVSGGALAELVQLATNTNETLATTGTLAASLSAAVTAASRSIYFATYNTNDVNVTVESGHTLIARLPSQTSPAVGMLSGWHATTFDTSPSITNSTGSTNAFGIVAFEIPVAILASTVTRGTSPEVGRGVTGGKAQTVARGTETDVARAVTAGVGAIVGRASETAAARGVAADKATTVGRGGSPHVGRAVTKIKIKVVTRPSELDVARPLVTALATTVGRAEEADDARRIHFTSRPDPTPIQTSVRLPTPISFVLGKMDGGENFGGPLDELIEPQVTFLWGPYEGSLTFRYPVGGKNWESLLVEKQEIIVLVGGYERDNCRFYVQKIEYDALKRQPVETIAHPLDPTLTVTRKQAATITVTCAQLWKRFDEYTIQPLTGAVVTHDKIFEAGTPAGDVGRFLLTDAHEHNALMEIDRRFDDALTSDDVPWAKTTEQTWSRGTTALPILQWQWDNHEVEFVMQARTLGGYNWDTLPINWANEDGPKIILVSGRDFLDAPIEKNYVEKANFVTVYGDEGRYVERWTGWPGPKPEKTWMVAKQASGVKDLTVLGEIADRWLEYYELGPRVERNHALMLGWGHDPLVTYVCGDEILYQIGDGDDPDDPFPSKAQRLRVVQMTLRKSATGEWSADIVLQDRIAQRGERFLRQINGLIGGGPGVSRPSRFAVPPAPPGVSVPITFTSEIYTPEIGSGGKNYARTTGETTWTGFDDDGAVCGDFKRFWLRWQYGVTKPGWNEVPASSNPDNCTGVIDGLEPGKHIRIQFGAEDTSGNFSWDSERIETPTTEFDLPTDNGEYRAFDADGQDTVRIGADGSWHVQRVPGGALDATGPGINMDSEVGYKVFGAGGTRLINHDFTNGDAEYLGNMHIGGTLLVDGMTTIEGSTTINDSLVVTGTTTIGGTTTINDDTTINDTLTVNAATTVDGNFTVNSSGSPVFVVNGGGATLTGKLIAGGITIDAGVMSLGSGSASITFSGGLITTSGGLAAGGSLSTSSTLTVTGFASLNGGGSVGAASGDSAGMHGSATTLQTVTGSRGGNAALADLLSKLDAKGVIANGTSA